MTEKYRRYDKRQKLAVVMAAEVSGVTAAAEATGIPHQTISYWMERPEFVEIRRKTREDLADEIKTVAHLAWQRTAEKLRDDVMEPRDILFAAEKATGLQLLMAGEATARVENSLLTGRGDHEQRILGDIINAELERRADADADGAQGPDPVAQLAAREASTPGG